MPTADAIAPHSTVENALYCYQRRNTRPDRIVVPAALFANFHAANERDDYADSVWGIPVVVGDVTEITCEGGKPRPRWWEFWKTR